MARAAADGPAAKGGSLALARMATSGTSHAEAAAALSHGAVDSLPEGALADKLALAEREARPLRVKLGIDPAAPDIHLGHVVVLQRLREFQDAGHRVVLIIGDYTARVGDPSGRSATRPVLSGEEIDANAATYREQAFRVLDPDPEKVEVRRNSEWLNMAADELFTLARTATVAQLLERDDFALRFEAGTPISVLELLYPLLQGFDSVAVDADVELGGTDQKFNLLLGRDVQRAYGRPQQAIMTLPILPGIDGVQKMSKSLDNYIGVTEPPEEIYGKTLRISDALLPSYRALLLDDAHDQAGEPMGDLAPRDAKRALARRLVARFHGEDAAGRAEAAFDRLHIEHQPPQEIAEATFMAPNAMAHLPAVIEETLGLSRSEARRLLAQGGVRLDGSRLGPDDQDLPAQRLDGAVLQVGKRRFRRLRRR